MPATGYQHPAYAASFSEWGRPVWLGRSDSWLLERDIPGGDGHDAMGLYPLCCCRNWSGLREDLDAMRDRWVAVSLVRDPMAEDTGDWRDAFDAVRAYRDHFVVETGSPGWVDAVHPRHRKHARRALAEVAVRVEADPASRLDDWERLFGVLAERHGIRGMRRFSRTAFAAQLRVPGMVMFVAERGGEVLGLDLWYVQDGTAQGHLAAFSQAGYECHASYAAKWALLHHFAAAGIRWTNLGGAAGEGLRAFKAGWTPLTRTAHLCTRILRPARYEQLARAANASESGYFPAYRAGEFS